MSATEPVGRHRTGRELEEVADSAPASGFLPPYIMMPHENGAPVAKFFTLCRRHDECCGARIQAAHRTCSDMVLLLVVENTPHRDTLITLQLHSAWAAGTRCAESNRRLHPFGRSRGTRRGLPPPNRSLQG